MKADNLLTKKVFCPKSSRRVAAKLRVLWGLLWGFSGFAQFLARAQKKTPQTHINSRPLSDRELKTLPANGATDRGIGEGLTFEASATAARNGKASWILILPWGRLSNQRLRLSCVVNRRHEAVFDQ